MTPAMLQIELKKLGTYPGDIDGKFGAASRAALVMALTKGPDTMVTPADMMRAATALNVPLPAVQAVRAVEAAGAGFQDGRPKILFEGHIFSRLTEHKYDKVNPRVSYPKWDKTKYPASQTDRYEQLAQAVSLDIDCGLQSASYGAFQILGANFALCGYASPWQMVYDLSLTEGKRLDAFVNFVRHRGLDQALRDIDFKKFADGYNGTASSLNGYAQRLVDQFKAFGGVVPGDATV